MKTRETPEQREARKNQTLANVAGSNSKVYAGWNPAKKYNTDVGGNQVVAGLSAMKDTNPYLSAKIVANSTLRRSGDPTFTGTMAAINSMHKYGIVDKDGKLELADGRQVDMYDNSAKKAVKGKNPKIQSKADIDTDNEMEYLSSVAGVGYSRTIMGKSGNKSDYTGRLLAANVTAGSEYTKENSSKMIQNYRKLYASQGIHSKEQAYTLANQALSEKRISADSYHQMTKSYDLVFDADETTVALLLGARKMR